MVDMHCRRSEHVVIQHKCIVRDSNTSRLFLWLANTCLQSGHWPAKFKASTTVVIPKPGKPLYDTPKAFRLIVLLNTLGKMFEKMLSNRHWVQGKIPCGKIC
jgi:hypothetical protein